MSSRRHRMDRRPPLGVHHRRAALRVTDGRRLEHRAAHDGRQGPAAGRAKIHARRPSTTSMTSATPGSFGLPPPISVPARQEPHTRNSSLANRMPRRKIAAAFRGSMRCSMPSPIATIPTAPKSRSCSATTIPMSSTRCRSDLHSTASRSNETPPDPDLSGTRATGPAHSANQRAAKRKPASGRRGCRVGEGPHSKGSR